MGHVAGARVWGWRGEGEEGCGGCGGCGGRWCLVGVYNLNLFFWKYLLVIQVYELANWIIGRLSPNEAIHVRLRHTEHGGIRSLELLVTRRTLSHSFMASRNNRQLFADARRHHPREMNIISPGATERKSIRRQVNTISSVEYKLRRFLEYDYD